MAYCENNENLGIPIEKTFSITNDDLRRIFTEIKKSSIFKNYYGGLGGPCMSSIDIEYTTDDKYELSLILNKLIDVELVKDGKILSFLKNTNYTIKKYSVDVDLNTEVYIFKYTYDENIINTIIDEYTK